jgi:hypothetical protein
MVTIKKKSTVRVWNNITIAHSGLPENAQIQPCDILKVNISRKAPNLISIKVKPRNYKFIKKGSGSFNAIVSYMKEANALNLINKSIKIAS